MKIRIALLGIMLLACGIAGAEDICTNKELDETNTPPVAIGDAAYVRAGGMAIPVLANDVVGAGGTLAIVGVGPCALATPCTTITTARGGTATVQGTNIFYTPPAVWAADEFEYSVRDTTQPGSLSTAMVTILVAATVDLQYNCTDGHCRFTAVPTITEGIREFNWWWGDVLNEQPKRLVAQVGHTYGSSGSFNVRVDVVYWAGNTVTAQKVVPVAWRQTATWNPVPDAFPHLTAAIENIRGIETFPFSTIVGANWSPNAADCPACGGGENPSNAFFDFVGSCPTTCGVSMVRGYYRPGTYRVTLRFQPPRPSDCPSCPLPPPKDYSIPVTVTNARPSATFVAREENVLVPHAGHPPRTWRFEPGMQTSQGVAINITDDGPFPLTLEWDFGDGSVQEEDELYDSFAATIPDNTHPPGITSQMPQILHTYQKSGTYNVTLKVRDAAGEVGFRTQQVVVVNHPPVPKISVSCRSQLCTFSAEQTTDEDDTLTWEWNVGDGRALLTAKEITVAYASAGCYVVSLKVTDREGAHATTRVTVPVGPALVPESGGVVVDAHVQTDEFMQFGRPAWQTSNGNLNGIMEPGETVVVEPRWPIAPTTALRNIWLHSLTGNDPYISRQAGLFTPMYDLSSGLSDCWSGGRCWLLTTSLWTVEGQSYRDTNSAHDDLQLREGFGPGTEPTPGSPVRIHVGKSFDDVAVEYSAYGAIESALHAGFIERCDVPAADGSWGNPRFCPDTKMTRAAIAPWLLKAKYGESYTPPACSGTGPFTDVSCAHPQASWIAQLKTEGITRGTGDGSYFPGNLMTRAELAVFLLRAKLGGSYVPPACTQEFTDVSCPGHWAADWISELKRRGVTAGCTPTTYCPEDTVSRAQAATFFVRNFNRSIATTQCPAGTVIHRQVFDAESWTSTTAAEGVRE